MKADRDGVLVTGGAKGIGKAISLHLAGQGWRVTVCGRDKAHLSEMGALGMRALEVDLSSPSGPEALAQDWADNGLPRALICNAGNYGELGRLVDVDIDAWQRSFDLNLFSVARLLQRYLRDAMALPEGPGAARRKVVVLSGGGLGAAKVWPARSAYACAKAALYELVSLVHEEVFEQGFDVNCLAPGGVSTGITEQATRAGATRLGALYDSMLKVQEGGGDSPELAAVMTAHLLSARCDGLSGRLISAKWDKRLFESPAQVAADGDLYRLRRIDDELYRKA